MRENKLTPVTPEIKEPVKPTNSDAVQSIASNITEGVLAGMDDGSIDTVEATGQLSMAILWERYSAGLLDDKQVFAFLKEMASKKTQAPVQRVEQHVKMDLRTVFAEISQTNIDQQATTLQQADIWDGEVREKLQLQDDMMLAPREEDEAVEEADFEVTPPPEIEDIRSGGDGSERRQRWANEGARIPSYRKDDK